MLVLLPLFLPIVLVRGFIEAEILTAFSQTKHVSTGLYFSCKSAKENLKLFRDLLDKSLRIAIVNVDEYNISKIEQVMSKYHSMILSGDDSCESLPLMLVEAGERKYFQGTHYWLIFGKSAENTSKIFEKVTINIDAEVNIVVPEGTYLWSIHELYNPAKKHGGKTIINPIGFYSKYYGYQAKRNGNKYWLRKNMTGVIFKSAVVVPNTVTTDLGEYLGSEDNREMNSMHRFQSVTVKYCRDIYNFTMVMKKTDSWGYIQQNGRFNGLVSLLEHKLIDFGSSPLIFKMDRLPVIDYSYGNWILRSAFIFRKPKIVPSSFTIFLRPLSTSAWLTISLTMFIILLALKLAFSGEKKYYPKPRRTKHMQVDSTWSMLFLFTLGAFCQQGATCFPRSFSSRILSVFVFLFCILTYQFYSASIVSYLLMDTPRTINTLKDLVDSPLEAGIEDILIDRDYFVQTTDPAAIDLFTKKIKGQSDDNNTGFYPPDEGLDLVRKGGFAFHVETSTAYPIIEDTFTNQEICDLEEVQMYRTQPMYTNLQKHSPFKEMFNYCMLRLVEDGHMVRLRKYWDARKPSCIESAKKIEIHVSLKEFSCGLIALTYGISISLIFLLIEFASFNWKNPKNKLGINTIESFLKFKRNKK